MDNLFSNLPARLAAELCETLLETNVLKIERIVSTGHRSPDRFWYDQSNPEWVAVLQGEARLVFAEEDETRTMKAGDFVHIPAHRRHRVEWTSQEQPTVWLAIHYQDDN